MAEGRNGVLDEIKVTGIVPTKNQQEQDKLRQQALDLLTQGGALNDILPPSILDKFTFPTLKDALQFVHRQKTDANVDLLDALTNRKV